MRYNRKYINKQTISLEKLQVRKITGLYTNPQRLLSPLLYLYKEFSKKNTSEKLLISLFFILPWNLGKHFEIPSSYINGILIPYLIPTLYFQDILLVGIIFSNLVKSRLSFFNHAFNRLFIVRIFVLFMFACLLSIFFSSRSFPSWYLFGRFLLVFVFMLSSAKLFTTSSIRRAFFLAIIVNLLLVCLLGVVQFALQSSVFHNYLFFGEQPYSGFTPFIAKESYQGVAKIPPYSVFMHPNILAGFVVISLTFVVNCLFRGFPKHVGLRVISLFILLLGLYVLYLTKSYTAWIAMLFSFLLLFRMKPFVMTGLGLAIIFLGLTFPFWTVPALKLLPADSTLSVLSVNRRANLLIASYRLFLTKPFFGWGLNSFTYSSGPFYRQVSTVRFYQPVHNVFALLAAEVGLFGVLSFIALFLLAIYYSARLGNRLYSVILLQICLLASFDHYFLTIHQTWLLFILTLVLALTYTKDTYCL